MECFVETSTIFTCLCTLCICHQMLLGDGAMYECGIQLFNNINNNLCREMYTVHTQYSWGGRREQMSDVYVEFQQTLANTNTEFILRAASIRDKNTRFAAKSRARIRPSFTLFRHLNYEIWSENQWVTLPQRVTDSNESFAKLANCVYIVSTKSALELTHSLSISQSLSLFLSLSLCVCLHCNEIHGYLSYLFVSFTVRPRQLSNEAHYKSSVNSAFRQMGTRKRRED